MVTIEVGPPSPVAVFKAAFITQYVYEWRFPGPKDRWPELSSLRRYVESK
jgi:hypothetical protein